MSSEEKTNVQSGDKLVEEFDPPSDWDRKKESDTLILMLPGFRKEQLRVQVSSKRVLRLTGERKISENKWRKFRKDEKLSDFHDTSGISAKFEAGMLYVRLPKIIKPIQEEPPSKTDQTTTDHKSETQQSSDQKEPKDQEQTEEQSKTTEEQTTLVQKPKEDHKDSQREIEKEKSKAVPEEKSKASEAQKMHESIQTGLKEQNKDLQEKFTQKEEDHGEDVQKKLTQKELDQKKLPQEEKGKAETDRSNMVKDLDEGLSKRSVVKMKKSLNMIYGLVEEVKKKNKMPHFVVLIFLVLLIGLYIKSLVKSSFGGVKHQEF